jgi:hypothetical protein
VPFRGSICVVLSFPDSFSQTKTYIVVSIILYRIYYLFFSSYFHPFMTLSLISILIYSRVSAEAWSCQGEEYMHLNIHFFILHGVVLN